MRLIDADEVIKELNYKIARLDAKQQIYMSNGLTSIADSMARKIELCIECRELLEHQPTAYDVDKVIKEIESCFNATEGKGRRLAYHRAITIVKGGINGLD